MKGLRKVKKIFVDQWFIFGIGAIILLAYLAPQPGRKGGWLHPEITSKYVSVVVIFILTGLAIKVAALKNALLSWKIQLCLTPPFVFPAAAWLQLGSPTSIAPLSFRYAYN